MDKFELKPGGRDVAHRWLAEKGVMPVPFHQTWSPQGTVELFEVEGELLAIYPEVTAPNHNPDSWITRVYLAGNERLIQEFELEAPRLAEELRKVRDNVPPYLTFQPDAQTS